MKRYASLLIYLVGFIILQSCNTMVSVSTVKLEIVVPGKIVIPPEYKKVAIKYNNSNVGVNSIFSDYFQDNNKLTDTINMDSIASEIYYNVFVDKLKYQQFFDTIIELDKTNYSEISLNDSLVFAQIDINADSVALNFSNMEIINFTKMVNRYSDSASNKTKTKFIDPELGLYLKKDIQQIADTTGADLLMSFDYFASTDRIYSPNYKRGSSVTAGILQPKSLYSTEIVYTLSCWNFYDLTKQELLYSKRKMDTIRWTAEATYLRQAIQRLPPRKDAVLLAADIAASNFSDFLVPHWIEVERMYYKSGHIELAKTEELIEQNRWLEAAEIWKKNTTNKNKAVAAKSMFNLALACEMNGDFDAAIDWTVKSFHVFGSKNEIHAFNCQNYIRILGMRKIDIKAIEN